MGKAKALGIVNPILAVVLAVQVSTGFLRESLPHELFETVHAGGGTVLVILAAIHVILNWSWIKTRYFGVSKSA